MFVVVVVVQVNTNGAQKKLSLNKKNGKLKIFEMMLKYGAFFSIQIIASTLHTIGHRIRSTTENTDPFHLSMKNGSIRRKIINQKKKKNSFVTFRCSCCNDSKKTLKFGLPKCVFAFKPVKRLLFDIR